MMKNENQRDLLVYMAGNMTPNPEIYYEWINNFTKHYNSVYNNNLTRQKTSLRLTYSNYKTSNKMIVRQDLARLSKADIVVVNLGVEEINHHCTGLVVECYEAYKQNKPVYAFVSDNLKRSFQADSPWVSEFIAKEFDSEGDLVEYLVNEENIPV